MRHWRLKLSLFLNFLVLAILLNSVGTVALQVQRMYGVSAPAAGWLAVCKGLGIVAASFAAVSCLAKFGYRTTMLCSLGVFTVVCVLVPRVPSLVTLELLFVAVGAGFALMKVSAYAMIGLFARDWPSHVSFMNFIDSFYSAGIVLGYFLFGAFADDADPHSTAWLRVFYIVGALSFLAFVLLLSTKLDEPPAPTNAKPAWNASLVSLGRLAGTRPVLLFATCIFLYVMVEQGVMNWLPTLHHQVLHLPARLSIQLSSLLTLAIAVGRLSAGFLLRRTSWFFVLAAGIAIAATALIIFAVLLVKSGLTPAQLRWAGIPLTAIIFPLVGFLLAPIHPVLNSAMLHALPLRDQGAMAALSVIFSALGSAIGTVALAYLFQAQSGSFIVYFSLIPLAALLGSSNLLRREV